MHTLFVLANISVLLVKSHSWRVSLKLISYSTSEFVRTQMEEAVAQGKHKIKQNKNKNSIFILKCVAGVGGEKAAAWTHAYRKPCVSLTTNDGSERANKYTK